MSISEELQRLDELRRDGVLSNAEFDLAKRQVLEGPDHTEATEQLGEIRAQNEVAQLDREWDLERENYMMTGKYRRQYKPTKAGSVFAGILITAFCVFWVGMANSMPSFGPMGIASMLPLIGVLFGAFAVSKCIQGFIKAGQFEEAQSKYKLRRNQLLNENGKT